MKRIGIFVDVSNLYFCVAKRYNWRKLDYQKYYAFIKDFGEVTQALAYGAQVNDEAANFIHRLKAVGFMPKYKAPKEYKIKGTDKVKRRADWDVGITIDIVNMAPRLDVVVLGSGDGDLKPTVEWCRNRGIDVIIIACCISRDLKECATEYIEIPESLLETAETKES